MCVGGLLSDVLATILRTRFQHQECKHVTKPSPLLFTDKQYRIAQLGSMITNGNRRCTQTYPYCCSSSSLNGYCVVCF